MSRARSGTPPAEPARRALEERWLRLTRTSLPRARRPGWPVRHDHCFQRILLDAAFGGAWHDHVRGRPAFRHAPDRILAEAVRLGEDVLAGREDLAALNRTSLAWRGKGRAC